MPRASQRSPHARRQPRLGPDGPAHGEPSQEAAMSQKPGKEFWLAALRHEGAAFRAAVSVDGLNEPVPSRPERPPHEEPSDEAVFAWWDERYAELLATLDRLDAEQSAWNWAPQPKKAVFWHRRMAHETAIHRWDAQVATGLTEPIETKLAVDGVAEVLDTWLPGGRRRGPADRSGLVQLVGSDVDHEWLIRIRGAGVSLLDTSTVIHEPHKIDAQAVGTASDLHLALWGRIPFDVLETAGNLRLLE